MASIPSPIREWVREFITGEGSDEVSSQAPVQSVNSQTGNVTVTAPVDSVNGETGTVSLSASDVGALASSSDVDHQQTTNRTHNGDDIEPDSVTTQALEAEKANTRSGYVDVTSSRSFYTTETNTTESDLNVSVAAKSTADGTRTLWQISVDGTVVTKFDDIIDSGSIVSQSVTVPASSNYKVAAYGDSANYEIEFWNEQQ